MSARSFWFGGLLLLFLGCSLVSTAQTPAARTATPLALIKGRVIKVADGDTVTLLDDAKQQFRVRFAGIDAPEHDQAWGSFCQNNLSQKVLQQDVTAQFFKTDKYGRNVSKVIFQGRDINLEQVREGCGWHYKKYENEQPAADRISYAEAETAARTARRGLWADPNPINPSVWRSQQREARWGGPPPAETPIIANKNSHKYHLPGCPGYKAVSQRNRELFANEEEAEDAGYVMAGNCSYQEATAGLQREGFKGTDYPFSGRATTNREGHPSTENGTQPIAKEKRTLSVTGPPVVGNRESRIYHLPSCSGYKRALGSKNRVDFASPAAAEQAGLRRAKNCS